MSEIVRRGTWDRLNDRRYVANHDSRGEQVVRRHLGRGLRSLLARLLLEGFQFLLKRVDTLGRLRRGNSERPRDFSEDRFFRLDEVERRLTRERGDPAGSCRDRLLADDAHEANLAGVGQMRSAAKLAREVPHLDHSDVVGILLAEQGHCAERPGLLDRHDGPVNVGRFEDSLVDGFLDLLEPFLANRLGVREVESEPVGLDAASRLLGMLAEVDMEGVVEHVGRGVCSWT